METSGTPSLVRSMRRWDLVGVVLNGVIGAGIFGLPSEVFALAGPYSIFAFLICAVCVAAIVLCFAEVASRYYGHRDGPYLYASDAYGPASGLSGGVGSCSVARLTSFRRRIAACLPACAWALFFPALATGAGRGLRPDSCGGGAGGGECRGREGGGQHQ